MLDTKCRSQAGPGGLWGLAAPVLPCVDGGRHQNSTGTPVQPGWGCRAVSLHGADIFVSSTVVVAGPWALTGAGSSRADDSFAFTDRSCSRSASTLDFLAAADRRPASTFLGSLGRSVTISGRVFMSAGWGAGVASRAGSSA